METPGWKINAKFYPLVTMDEWVNGDFTLCQMLTRVAPEELFSPDGSIRLQLQALQGIAFQHGEPRLGMDHVVEFMHSIKPGDAEGVGFAQEEDIAVPPADASADAAPGNGSLLTSEPLTELTLDQ